MQKFNENALFNFRTIIPLMNQQKQAVSEKTQRSLL